MQNQSGESLPRVTVIMPIRNEAAFIHRSLGAVLEQDYPSHLMEILIADGMSDDDTIAIVNALNDPRVRVLSNPRRIQSAGLNVALHHATSDVIIRIDGHTIIAPDYVRCCVETLQETNAWNVGGAMDPVGVTPTGKAIAAAGKSVFAVPSAFHTSQTPQFTDTVYLGAWQRFVFERIGGFNEHVGVNEDYELNVRIRKAGGTIYFSPRIRSQYVGRQTLHALAHQYFRYGRSKVRTLRAHPSSLRTRQIVAPGFVAFLLISGMFATISRPIRALWAIVIGMYGMLNVLFSFRIARRTSGVDLWRLPIVFFVIHLFWGAGFWRELFDPS
jgi:succinoglycan biosynthesis protein ExoA